MIVFYCVMQIIWNISIFNKRSFTFLQLADILALSGDSLMSYCIPLKQADLKKARSNSDVILDDTWKWLWKVMETTETQLRY